MNDAYLNDKVRYNLILVKFPGGDKVYLFTTTTRNYYNIECGENVIVATSRGKSEGTVVGKNWVTRGSDMADFINTWNQNREVKPIIGKVEYFEVKKDVY